MLASLNGKLEIVKELIRLGANVNVKDGHKFSALMYVCKIGNYEIVQELLNNGAEIDFIDGLTPLMIASQCGHLQIVQELLNRGANIDAHITDIYDTPLQCAVRIQNIDIVKELITRGANVNINYAYMLQSANPEIREILQKYHQNQ